MRMIKIIGKASYGSSLIEVLVALFVLGVGLLGVLAMQVKSVQLNQNAYLYSQAAFLANDLMESMRTTGRDSMSTYDDGIPNNSADCDVNLCSPNQMVEWHLFRWQENIESLLPGGEGEVVGCNASSCIIEVRFVDANIQEEGVNDERLRVVSLTVGL